MMQFSWFWLKFLCTTLTDKSELFKSPHEYFFLFVLTHSIKIRGQISLRGHTSLMFHCCFNCDSIHLSEAFGLPELKMCWYLSTMILSRIASILQKSFNLKFYDTFPVFLYCFDSYPGRKVELQDCKILAFFQQFLWGIGGKRITRPILGPHAETKVKITQTPRDGSHIIWRILDSTDTSTIHPLAMLYAKAIWQLFMFNQLNNF